eukprot:6679207-Pyramimonas_sp.AAC.1
MIFVPLKLSARSVGWITIDKGASFWHLKGSVPGGVRMARAVFARLGRGRGGSQRYSLAAGLRRPA